MNITVHFPDTPTGKQMLAEKISEAQAMGIKSYMNHLPCPKQQKVQILTELRTVK